MIKNVIISILNAFYYLTFSMAFLIFTYEADNYSFYFFSILLIIPALYPIIQWIVSLYQHVLIRAYFTKKDIIYKFFPILLLILAWGFKTNHSMEVFIECSTYLSFILFIVPFFLKSFEMSFTYPMKMLKNIINQITTSVKFSSENIIKFNWTPINNMIKDFTQSSYYIIDNCDFDLGDLNVFSSGRQLKFNYENRCFVVDGVIVSSAIILDMQKEYQRDLFLMSDEQLNLVKMIAI